MSNKNNHARTVIAAAIAAVINASSAFAYDIPYILDENTNQEDFKYDSSLNLLFLESDSISTSLLNAEAISANTANFGGLTNSIIPIQGKAEFLILEPIDNGDGTITSQNIIIRGGGSVETKSSGGVMIDNIGNVSISSVMVQEETQTSDTAHVVVRDANGLTVSTRLAYGHYDENTGIFTENDINIVTSEPVDLGGGNLEVGGDVVIEGSMAVSKDIYADGDAVIEGNMVVSKDIIANADLVANGKIFAIDDVLVSGLLSGLGDVSVGKNLLVSEDVSAQGDAVIGGDVYAVGRLVTSSNVEAEGGVYAKGDVSADGDVYAGGNAVILGDVAASGKVDTNELNVANNATINGDLTVKGQVHFASNPNAGLTLSNDANTGDSTITVGVKNAAGETNGVAATSTTTTIRGGTGTTTAVLDDSGFTVTTVEPVTNITTGVTKIDKNGNLVLQGSATTVGITNTGNINNTGKVSTTTLAVSGASTTTGITNTGNLTSTGNTTLQSTSGTNSVAVTNAGVNVAASTVNVTATTSAVTKGGTTSLTLNNTGATFAGTASAPVVVSGVANGVKTNDAVNYGQLNSFRNQVQAQIDSSNVELSRGIASTVAMSNIPALDTNKTFSLGVGIGHYNNSNAFAVGANYRINDGIVVRASAGRSGSGSSAIGAGAALAW